MNIKLRLFSSSGGWVLVANLVYPNTSLPPPLWKAERSYRAISSYSNNVMGISKGAMRKLRTHLSFTQIRFFCINKGGRTFHVATAANSSGEDVVQYFTGQTNILPASCGSFQRMSNDNSHLSVTCDQWGKDGSYYVGKWGHHMKQGLYRMYNHAAFVKNLYYWKVMSDSWSCDDGGSELFQQNVGNFWKVYVR